MKYINKGTYPVYFKGSNRTYKRAVYYNHDDGRLYCKWYGKYIEITRNTISGYPVTVEDY